MRFESATYIAGQLRGFKTEASRLNHLAGVLPHYDLSGALGPQERWVSTTR
jgi:hypothetical protein